MAEQQEDIGQAVVEKVRQKLEAQRGRREVPLTGAQDVAEESSPQPDVPPDSSPEQDVEPESSPGEQEAPKQPSDKEVNFKRLREERDRERRLRENYELELAELRRKQREEEAKANENDRVKELWQQLQSQRPDDFEEWDQDKQVAWTARQAILQGLDKELGIGKELRQIRDENRIVRRFPSLDDDQVSKVLEIYQQAAGALNEKEAYEVAKQRDPDLFSEPEASPSAPATPAAGTVPPSHQVMEPSRDGAHRAPPDEEAEVNQAIANAFSDSPGFLSPDKRAAIAQKMKMRLGKKGFLPG